MKKQNKNTIIFSVVLIVGLSIGAALFFDYWKENRAVTIDENYCNQYQPDFCPDGCIVCPPCLECSSIQCRLASSCETIGFDKNWYRQTKPSSATPSSNDKLKSNINTFMESQVSQNALGTCTVGMHNIDVVFIASDKIGIHFAKRMRKQSLTQLFYCLMYFFFLGRYAALIV